MLKTKGCFSPLRWLPWPLKKERKPGVVHLQDLTENTGGMVNLTRVSKEVVAEIAAIYKDCLVDSDGGCGIPDKVDESILDSMDWRKPFRFMPDRLEHIPEVFELLQCEVLVHPVRFSTSLADTIHHVASLLLDEVTVISAEPNRFEVGPHPDKIEF
jgi:hypothetical protein